MGFFINPEFYEMIKGFPHIINTHCPPSTITTTTTTIALTQTHVPTNTNPMLDDWNALFDPVDATMPPFTTNPTIDTSAPTVTTTPAIPTNDNQLLADWSLGVMVNSYPTTVDPSFSFAHYRTTFTPTTNIIPTPIVPARSNQMMGDCGLGAVLNGFYPIANNSLTTSIVNTMNTTKSFPTKTNNTSLMHHQTPNNTFCWNPNLAANSVPLSPSSPLVNNQKCYGWEQHTRANNFLGATTTTTTHPSVLAPTTTNQGQQLLNLNNPSNIQNTALFCKTWPLLTLPGYGKLIETPTHKQQQQQQNPTHKGSVSLNITKHTENVSKMQNSLDIFKCTNKSAKSSPGSDKRKMERRIYKMPLHAAKHDAWSWRKFYRKTVDGSPYPRVYYKCNTSKDCLAKRRTQLDRSDPDLVTIKYTGDHCHPRPWLVNSSVDSTIMNPADSGININYNNNNPTVNSEINKEDNIFEELAYILDFGNDT